MNQEGINLFKEKPLTGRDFTNDQWVEWKSVNCLHEVYYATRLGELSIGCQQIVTCGAPRVPNERGRDTYMKVGYEYGKFNT